MKRVLVPLPQTDFDPTEAGVPFLRMKEAGFHVTFATPAGRPAAADPRMLTGDGLGPFKHVLMADRHGRDAYRELSGSPEFRSPITYEAIDPSSFDALLLPGGHAKGMREYLEAKTVQAAVGQFFLEKKPVGAICHGTLLAARSVSPTTGQSVLRGRRTTGLQRRQELLAWVLTRAWLGDYYRTYPTPMETELRSYLRADDDYLPGPLPLRRDSPTNLKPGFTVRDNGYLSARWPGDAHRFAAEWVSLLKDR